MEAILQVFESWAWIGWIVLIAVFLVIEMLTLDLTFLMLALGGAVGLLSGLAGLPVWAQMIVAAVAAAAFILLIRPPLLRRLRHGEDGAKSNVEALIGLNGVVLLEVSSLTGQVKLGNGDTWTARLDSGSAPLGPGSSIAVSRIEGATAYVRSAHD